MPQILHLSVTSVPFSIGGIAGIDLLVSITDSLGQAYLGLSSQNFTVIWLSVSTELPIQPIVVTEFTAAAGLPVMPGVYGVNVRSLYTRWAPPSAIYPTFFIAVQDAGNQGQTLYSPQIELLPL